MTRDKIFVSYSHRDRQWLDELKTMLAPVQGQFALELWDDSSIPVGSRWEEEIERTLDRAAVAILLVSKHFLASPLIQDKEMPAILKAAQDRELRVFWILVGSCFWTETPIRHFQAAHDTTTPLALLQEAERDGVLHGIGEKLLETVRTPRGPAEARLPRQDRIHQALEDHFSGLFGPTGITHAYVARQEAANDMLRDIANATEKVELFARVYISELFFEPKALPSALLKAIEKREADTQSPSSPLIVRNVATDPKNDARVTALHRLEDPRHIVPPRWETDEDYRRHLIDRSENKMARCASKLQFLADEGETFAAGQKRDLAVFEKHCFHDWITPYSLVAVDRKVIYVGFYLLNRKGTQYGKESPSIRITEGKWFQWFLKEIEYIEERYIANPHCEERRWVVKA